MDLSDSLDGAFEAARKAPAPWKRAAPGEQLRVLRLDRGMSQRHLAESARISRSIVSRLENGGDARWEIWRRLFYGLGYEVFLVPQSGDEGVEDMIEDEKQQRRDREEAGRSARWG